MPPITRAQLEARLQLVEEQLQQAIARVNGLVAIKDETKYWLEQLADDVHAEPAKEVLT